MWNKILRLSFCLLTLGMAQGHADAPFWKSKEKVYERVQNGDIVVSVSTREVAHSTPSRQLRVAGGGQVKLPRDFVFATAQKYEDLARASDYIRSAQYDAATHQVALTVEAFGYKAQARVEVHPVVSEEPWRIDYKVIAGPLAGMTGAVSFANLGAKTEVGLTGEYKYEQFPIPRLFLEFGMEFMLQRMAARLRAFAREEFEHRAKLDKGPPLVEQSPAHESSF